ncbi:MAG: hypothetical protein HQM08_24870 [Candidatus Riflebacteria bacterium]|nr:hypothetical protein [Candidatus Riflebacteria bacterium]
MIRTEDSPSVKKFYTEQELREFIPPGLNLRPMTSKETEVILKHLFKIEELNHVNQMIISNLEIVINKNKKALLEKDFEIQSLKVRIKELEARPLEGLFPGESLNKIPLSHLINRVVERIKDEGKLSILKKIVDENVELRNQIKGEIQ